MAPFWLHQIKVCLCTKGSSNRSDAEKFKLFWVLNWEHKMGRVNALAIICSHASQYPGKECVVLHIVRAHIRTSPFCLFQIITLLKTSKTCHRRCSQPVCLCPVHWSLMKASQNQSLSRLRTFSESSLDFWWGARLRTKRTSHQDLTA